MRNDDSDQLGMHFPFAYGNILGEKKLNRTAATRLRKHLKSRPILRDLRHTLEATVKTPQEISVKRGSAGG
jgi:hypothetical protein